MIKHFLFFAGLLLSMQVIAQTGIGTTSPDPSAKLHVSATDKGFLPPRMTSSQRTSISSPAVGLQVFDITTNSIWYYDGASWINTISVSTFGDVKTGFQSGDHSGWIKLDGRLKSSLTATQQTQATTLGIGSSLPDATNAFLVQNGSAVGAVEGSSTKTITQANLPNVTLTGSTSSGGSHTHTIPFATQTMNLSWAVYPNGLAGYTIAGNTTTSSSESHDHTLTTSSLNGNVTQTAFNVTPKTLSVNTFIYLGY